MSSNAKDRKLLPILFYIYFLYFLDCTKPPVLEGAMCLGYSIHFYWNNAQQRCIPFVYGGCRKTLNNFQSLEECEQVAGRFCKISRG